MQTNTRRLGMAVQDLCDQVTKAMEKNTKLKPVLGFLQGTLNSLRDEIFQGHQIFDNRDKWIQARLMSQEVDLVQKLHQGANLIAEISKLRPWHYLWRLDEYTERLLDLDRYLQNHRLMIIPPRKKFETAPLTQEQQLGREQVAAQDAFQRLFEAVRECDKKKGVPLMILPLLSDIGNTIQLCWNILLNPNQHVEWSYESKMWNCWYLLLIHNKPTEEVRSFRAEMDKGLEVVRRSCGVGRKGRGYSKTKYDCVIGLLRLNDYLQRRVYDAF